MSETGGAGNEQMAAASGQDNSLLSGQAGGEARTGGTQGTGDAGKGANAIEQALAAALDRPDGTGSAASTQAAENAGPQAAENAGPQDRGTDKDGEAGDKGGKPADKPGESAIQWEGLAAHIPPEAGLDPAIVESFAGAAKEMGLNPEQAKKLIDWQLEAVAQANARKVEQGMAALQKEWGANTRANLDQALQLVTAIDRAMGNENFSRSLGLYGIACDADFVRGLAHIARLVGEDSLGARANDAHAQKEETPLEGLQKLFK